MNQENARECIGLLSLWEGQDDLRLIHDLKGTSYVLKAFDLLPAKGGIIRVDGQVKAFAIGSVQTERMCQENIEKADESIRGLYQAILREFLIHEFPDFQYVNREDDMGIENLRKAKRAYQPSFMIEKYRLCKVGE